LEDLAVSFRFGLVAAWALALLVIMPNNLRASETRSAEAASFPAEPAPSFDPLVPEITDIAEPDSEIASEDGIGPS
jgi:hypothetical protein